MTKRIITRRRGGRRRRRGGGGRCRTRRSIIGVTSAAVVVAVATLAISASIHVVVVSAAAAVERVDEYESPTMELTTKTSTASSSLRQRQSLDINVNEEEGGKNRDDDDRRRLNWIDYFYNKYLNGGNNNNNNTPSTPKPTTMKPTMKPTTMKPTMSPIKPNSGTTTSTTTSTSTSTSTTKATTTTKATATTTTTTPGPTYCYPNMYELTCQCDSYPEPWMIQPANIKTWTFENTQACCVTMKFDCAGPTTTTTTTTTSATTITTSGTTTTTTTKPGPIYCYPNMYELKCVCDSYPEPWMILPANLKKWTFASEEDCCVAKEFACAPETTTTTTSTATTTTGSTATTTTTAATTAATTTTGGTTTATTTTTTTSVVPSQSYWYPDIRDELNTCFYGIVTDPILLENSSFYLFSTMCECCAKHDCSDMNLGDHCSTTTTTTTSTSAVGSTTTTINPSLSYWFPGAGGRNCRFDIVQDPNMLANPSMYLFSSLCDCCAKHGCSDMNLGDYCSATTTTTTTSTSAVGSTTTTKATGSTTTTINPSLSYWFPGAGGRNCRFDIVQDPNMLANPSMYLFSSLCDCCAKHGCSDMNLGDYCSATTTTTSTSAVGSSTTTKATGQLPTKKWYPKLSADASRYTACVYGSDYPEILDVGNHTFDTQEECCLAFEQACSVCNDVDGAGKAYWYPRMNTDSTKQCVNDALYPPEFFTNFAFCTSFLFPSKEECCSDYPEACKDVVGSLGKKWYPDFNTADSTNKVVNCVFDDKYPSYMALPDLMNSHLFASKTECCAMHPCGKEIVEYWFPVIDLVNEEITCEFGTHYPLHMLEHPENQLFENQAECEDFFKVNEPRTDAPTAFPTSLPPSTKPTQKPVTSSPTITTQKPVVTSTSSTTTTTTSTSTTAATTTMTTTPGPTVKKWYPKLSSDATKYTSCIYGSDYPQFYNVSTHTFDNLESCCRAFEEACTVCNDPGGAGKEYWYPHTKDGKKKCEKNALYPPEYFTDRALCTVLLFATKDECCLDFPEGCESNGPDNGVKKWYPDMINADKEKKIINCIFDNLYPPYMAMPDIVSSHLFDTEVECCTVYPCGKKLVAYWFPVINVKLNTLTCEFGTHYPMFMLENPEHHLYLNRAECEAFFEITQAPTKAPIAAPSTTTTSTTAAATPTTTTTTSTTIDATQSYWYPEIRDEINTCIFGVVKDPFLLKYSSFYLFSTLCECCAKHDCSDMNLGNQCSTTTTTTTTSTTAATTGTSSTMATTTTATTTFNPAQSYWHPGVDHCTFDIVTDPKMIVNPSLYLFSTLCECCAKHGCKGMNLGNHCETTTTSTSAVSTGTGVTSSTMATTTTATTTFNPAQSYWHPGVDHCTFDIVTDPKMIANPSLYLFSTLCECCAKHGCSGMNLGNHCSSSWTTTTSTSAVSTIKGTGVTTSTSATPVTTTTIDPSQSYWYPEIQKNIKACFFGVVTDSFLLNHSSFYLFSTMCECCAKHDCSAMNLGNYCSSSITTTTTTSTSTAATISSTTASTAASTTTSKGTDATTTTKATTTASTTKATSGPNDLVAYWFPVIDFDKMTLTCQFGTNYPLAMLKNPENQLYSSKAECEDFFDITASPTKAPIAAPKTTSTTSTTTTTATTAAVATMTIGTIIPDKPIYAYPDILNGFPVCLYDNQYPSFMTVGNNPKSYLFASVKDCCKAYGYRCTVEETSSPTPMVTSLKKLPAKSFWYSDIHADGNVCVFGTQYEWWMATDAYRATQLFTTMEECCQQHPCDDDVDIGKPNAEPTDDDDDDVVTFLNESFESGMSAVPWIHGGTSTHVSNWNVTTDKYLSGQYSMRSGNLNNMRGKSSDIRLKVDSSRGAQLKYSYYSDVGGPFDFFELKVDGELIEKEGSPSNGWREHSTYMSPGPHEILFRVIAPPSDPGFSRSNKLGLFGTGVVYVDNLEFRPL